MSSRHFMTMFMIALGSLAGCQHTARPQHFGLFGESSERRPKLSKIQAAEVQVALGRSLEKRGETAQAVESYQEALKRDPKHLEAYLRLAILHDQHGKFNESAAYYNDALKVNPDSEEIYCNLGYSCYLQNRCQEAEQYLRRALELNSEDPQAHNNLALVLARTERFEEAFAEFRKGGCDDAQAHSNLGFVLAVDQRWHDARTQYARALALNPSLETARHDLQAMNDLIAKHPTAAHNGASTMQLATFEEPAP